MKKFICFIGALLCITMVGMMVTSCGDDEEKKTEEKTTYTYQVSATTSVKVNSSDASGNLKRNADAEAAALLEYVKEALGGYTEKSWTTSTDLTEEAHTIFMQALSDANMWILTRERVNYAEAPFGSGSFTVSLHMKYSDSEINDEDHTLKLEYNK